MKPASIHPKRQFLWFVLAVLFVAHGSLQAQYVVESIDNPQSQADYVIICPQAYATTMGILASHRASFSNLRPAIVTTEAIYQIFGQGVRADSAIKTFVAYALTAWSDPKPQYFLLAGNINTVPSHREPGVVDDSVWVDEWFVEVSEDPQGVQLPAAAIGRLPGWDITHMNILVGKTVSYDLSPGAGWRSRELTVADYWPEDGFIFEDAARSLQTLFSPRWPDTLTAHVRTSSPQYRTRAQFRALWNNGVAMVTFIGHQSPTIFSHSYYFTTDDVDSLDDDTPLAFVRFLGYQPFDQRDTMSIVELLLLMPGKGAVCTLSPSGPAYFDLSLSFHELLIQAQVDNPASSIGSMILNIMQQTAGSNFEARRQVYLGDPALVIKNPLLAGGGGPGSHETARTFSLYQNFPNPFNPTTQIMFDLPRDGAVTLTLFNLLGQEVGKLINAPLGAGQHVYTLDAGSLHLSSGIYFYRLTSGDFVQTRKLVLMR